jgi:hypothetical protein
LREQHGFDFDRLLIPNWTTAGRPPDPQIGDIGYNDTLDRYEGWDGAAWDDLSAVSPVAPEPVLVNGTSVMQGDLNLGGFNLVNWPLAPLGITFTATTVFAYRHARGAYPAVQVLGSDGGQIEVCVRHPDNDTVVLTFDGTITNGVLVLT